MLQRSFYHIRFEDIKLDLLKMDLVIPDHYKTDLYYIRKELHSRLKQIFPWNKESLCIKRMKDSYLSYEDGLYRCNIDPYDIYAAYTSIMYPHLNEKKSSDLIETCVDEITSRFRRSIPVKINKGAILYLMPNISVVKDKNIWYISWGKVKDNENQHIETRDIMAKLCTFDEDKMLLTFTEDYYINIYDYPYFKPIEKEYGIDDRESIYLISQESTTECCIVL